MLKVSDNITLLKKKLKDNTAYEPMYIHSFRFITPKKVSEAQRFMLRFPTPDTITKVADKLRYYRYKRGLYQIDVADCIGITRTGYSVYEEYGKDYYAPETMNKIAELLEVDVYDLLDDYNKFLYNGQGQYIKRIRKKLGITQKELAKLMNTKLYKVKRWEQNKTRMFKSTWERLKDIALLPNH